MAGTQVTRPAGQTIALSVVATSHAAIPIIGNDNTQFNWVACINPGAVAVAIQLSSGAVPATLPVDGTPGSFLLPPLMQVPITLPCPSLNPNVTAIGATAGPTIIYVTPVVYQS
jgi:hypothetical protein